MSFGRGWSSRKRSKVKTKPPGATLRDWKHEKPVFIPKERSAPFGKTQFNIVILSSSSENLESCLKGVHANEPELMDRVVVVDDGARKGLKNVDVRWVSGVKPFVFSRNVNLGIQVSGSRDILLLNDDAVLLTKLGFQRMAQAVHERPRMGVCSASVVGRIGNPNQRSRSTGGVRLEAKRLAFVCVYIPRKTVNRVGLLDERFVGYGYDDDDYCRRVRGSGLLLGVFDPCVINHNTLPSTFGRLRDVKKLTAVNRSVFVKKWGAS